MNKCKIKVMQILGDPTGGIRKHVHDIVQNSCEYGIKAYYIHGSTLDSVAKIEINEFNLQGLKMLRLNIPKKPHVLDILNIFVLVLYCVKNNINVIHGHGAKGGVYSRLVGLLAGVPSLYTPHGGSVHAAYGKIEGFVYRAVERMLKSITRLYLFESYYTYKSFITASGKLHSSKFVVNYNGVDIKSLSSVNDWIPDANGCINLLVVGVLREIKGQAVAIHALVKLKQLSKFKFHLHFCGAGPDSEHLVSLVKLFGLFDNVSFHGEVEDVSQWYEISNIVIIPSLFESFGYVAIEAGLMRRPVVASNCGGLLEIISDGETGYLFPTGNADLLAEKIICTLEDIAKSTRIVNAAEARTKKKFNSIFMLNRIFSLYRQVVDSRAK
jgi:glycosyltransferase involved in cell wall biosynthesis